MKEHDKDFLAGFRAVTYGAHCFPQMAPDGTSRAHLPPTDPHI